MGAQRQRRSATCRPFKRQANHDRNPPCRYDRANTSRNVRHDLRGWGSLFDSRRWSFAPWFAAATVGLVLAAILAAALGMHMHGRDSAALGGAAGASGQTLDADRCDAGVAPEAGEVALTLCADCQAHCCGEMERGCSPESTPALTTFSFPSQDPEGDGQSVSTRVGAFLAAVARMAYPVSRVELSISRT